MPVSSQEKLFSLITEKKQLLTNNEMVQFYVENVQRSTCRVSYVYNFEGEYTYPELVSIAKTFYLRSVGKFVTDGRLMLFTCEGDHVELPYGSVNTPVAEEL